MKTAVLYLRVSTTSQVQTDYDPEGISIPAQRVACTRRAEQMGIQVIDEYVEPGRSGTYMDKRPVFQAMQARLKQEHDADYVIVYNLSRLNRNRVDDAKVLMLMRAMKVTLVSAQENIDETPAGQLMHGILAAFNEYRSMADGADIRYKVGQKAKAGGTLTRAKIGYLNVRDWVDGHEIRTVALDPERAPFITLAFELAASGEYTMTRLAQTLSDRGLRMRSVRGAPGAPISSAYLSKLLRDPYYLGVIVYQGEEYAGRHEALVGRELYDQVQAVLDSRAARIGQRSESISTISRAPCGVDGVTRPVASHVSSFCGRTASSPSTGTSCAAPGRIIGATCRIYRWTTSKTLFFVTTPRFDCRMGLQPGCAPSWPTPSPTTKAV